MVSREMLNNNKIQSKVTQFNQFLNKIVFYKGIPFYSW